ncbi:MAG: glycosyltransferase WbuB [Burkholderiales bacterium]|nr:glycosyltransferase WbuB [Burkholderiales bacterium]
MKILIYSANFAPEPTGIGKYSGELAEWLVAEGHEVRVVAAPPYYPNWKIAEGYARPYYQHEVWKGARVWRAPLWVPSNPGGLKRIVHLLSFAVTSLPLMLRQVVWQPDVVLTVAPAFVCAPAGWLTARLSGAAAWLHVQDFEIDVAFKMGLMEGRGARQALLWLERRMLRRFDVVSSISARMVEHLRQKGVDEDCIRHFPNWVDVDKVRPLAHVSAYRIELGIAPEATVALFSGTLGSKQGLMVIPQAAELLAHRKDVEFVICGDGAMKAELEAACAHLSNVRLLPLQPVERLSELLGLADIHLLPQSPEAEDLVLPSKLSGMLSSGRPIVATCRDGTEMAQVVSRCGLVVPPDDHAALALAIAALADQPATRRDMGVLARRFAEDHLAQKSVLRRWVQQIDDLLAPDPVSEHGA